MNADMMMVLDVLYIFGTVVIQQSQGWSGFFILAPF